MARTKQTARKQTGNATPIKPRGAPKSTKKSEADGVALQKLHVNLIQDINQTMFQWYRPSESTNIPFIELERYVQQHDNNKLRRLAKTHLKYITDRMVQRIHHQVNVHKHGIIMREDFFTWMGTSNLVSMKSRESRELDGAKTKDTILKYKFVGEELRNVPLSDADWFHFEVTEKTEMKRKLYFKLDQVTFRYNYEQEYMESAFKYTIMTQVFERTEDEDYDYVWTPVL